MAHERLNFLPGEAAALAVFDPRIANSLDERYDRANRTIELATLTFALWVLERRYFVGNTGKRS